MNTIRRYIALSNKSHLVSIRAFFLMYSKEIGVFLCTGFIALSVITYKPFALSDRVGIIKNLNLSSTKIFPMLKSNLATIDNDVLVAQRVDLEQMISDSMNYSYPHMKVSFTNKTIDDFFKLSKAEVEAKILESVPKTLQANAKKYLRAVLIMSEKYQVDPLWVFSIMWTESHFKFSATSSVGAQGLMQIMPRTHSFLYKKVKLGGKTLEVEAADFNMSDFFPYKVPANEYQVHVQKLKNIELGVIYLKRLLKRFNGNHVHATIAYNMGPSWTRRRLNNNLPVGVKNLYLSKVQRAYKSIVRRI